MGSDLKGLVTMNLRNLPVRQGLYDPQYEHDACGIGLVANIKGERSNSFSGMR
jgi:glutamate synthase (ferredoxin)